MKISRRSLAKRLAAAGAAAGLGGLLQTEPLAAATPESSAVWRRIYPGVWKATVGVPERFTPVSSRLVPAKAEAFAKLPNVDTAPLPDLRGKLSRRGCMVQLPLRPNEQIY